MEKKNCNEKLQSRREFFKKAAKGVLPILSVAVLAGAPAIVKANVIPSGCTHCTDACTANCQKSCSGRCTGTCKATCQGSCVNRCTGTCKAACQDNCNSSCKGSNKY
ncbi:MAG: Cys-Xaa-Xaa-Xaa repeat radical SAM target protein [Prevotella sp.]|nr:Cys-Xaa-Xaa-Xaa repeat radical SAM target protein [Prevotella sp.]